MIRAGERLVILGGAYFGPRNDGMDPAAALVVAIDPVGTATPVPDATAPLRGETV